MKIKYLVEEDFINYKEPSMFIGTRFCSGKCYKELGLEPTLCQNYELSLSDNILDIDDNELIERYLNNNITKAVVFGGLEPFDQYDELQKFIEKFRNEYKCDDMIVIYTGYNEDEVRKYILDILIRNYKNIIIKYGRYIPGREKKFDKVLGVNLASDNQYAERIT